MRVPPVIRKYPIGYGAGTKLYRAWRAIKSRCTVPTDAAYPRYGGAGVTIFQEWMDYGPFMEWSVSNGFAGNLSIDRVDPFGGYSPENCRWIPMRDQARNKRKPCHTLRAFGETKLEVDWVKDPRCVVSQTALRERVRLGWPAEEALTSPPTRVRRDYRESPASLTAFGETKPLAQWVNDPRCSVSLETLRSRVKRNNNAEWAVGSPPAKGARNDLRERQHG